MRYEGIEGRVAIVTGANHGIGAATAEALAGNGALVLVSYLRVDDRGRGRRARGLSHESGAATRRTSSARSVTPAAGPRPSRRTSATRRRRPGCSMRPRRPSGRSRSSSTTRRAGARTRSSRPSATGSVGRSSSLSASTASQMLEVDARGSALMIAEFARRHVARAADWGRIVGLTSGGALGFPEEVSYGAAKAALENYAMSAALELGGYGITSNVVHPPVTDTGWVTDAVRSSWPTAMSSSTSPAPRRSRR